MPRIQIPPPFAAQDPHEQGRLAGTIADSEANG